MTTNETPYTSEGIIGPNGNDYGRHDSFIGRMEKIAPMAGAPWNLLDGTGRRRVIVNGNDLAQMDNPDDRLFAADVCAAINYYFIMGRPPVPTDARADGVPVEKAVDLQKENDELRKEFAEAESLITTAIQGSPATHYGPLHWSNLARAFLARHQPPSAVDTQQVKP